MTNRVTDQGIWIESDLPLDDSPQWTRPLRLVKAVTQGEATNLGSVSPRLAANLKTIRDIYAAWIPGHEIPLCFELSRDAAAPSAGVSLFFSGGVDSSYSFVKHRDEVENLVLVHGFDVPWRIRKPLRGLKLKPAMWPAFSISASSWPEPICIGITPAFHVIGKCTTEPQWPP